MCICTLLVLVAGDGRDGLERHESIHTLEGLEEFLGLLQFSTHLAFKLLSKCQSFLYSTQQVSQQHNSHKVSELLHAWMSVHTHNMYIMMCVINNTLITHTLNTNNETHHCTAPHLTPTHYCTALHYTTVQYLFIHLLGQHRGTGRRRRC